MPIVTRQWLTDIVKTGIDCQHADHSAAHLAGTAAFAQYALWEEKAGAQPEPVARPGSNTEPVHTMPAVVPVGQPTAGDSNIPAAEAKREKSATQPPPADSVANSDALPTPPPTTAVKQEPGASKPKHKLSAKTAKTVFDMSKAVNTKFVALLTVKQCHVMVGYDCSAGSLHTVLQGHG